MGDANDYSRLGAVKADYTHAYDEYMKYCQDTANWFKRARGEWDESGSGSTSERDRETGSVES